MPTIILIYYYSYNYIQLSAFWCIHTIQDATFTTMYIYLAHYIEKKNVNYVCINHL